MLCPLCAKDLQGADLAMVCTAHGEIQGAAMVQGGVELDITRAQTCAEPGDHHHWLRHVGCGVVHPYWARLDDFARPISCIPPTYGALHHVDFEVYHQAWKLVNGGRIRMDARHDVVFGNDLLWILLARIATMAEQSGFSAEDFGRSIETLLDGMGETLRRDDVFASLAEYPSGDFQGIRAYFLEKIRAEVWFPDWMLTDEPAVEISMHGKTSVGKTVLSLQSMHMHGYGTPRGIGIRKDFLYCPPHDHGNLAAYDPGTDDNVKQHTLLQLLKGGDAVHLPPATQYRAGNLKAFQLHFPEPSRVKRRRDMGPGRWASILAWAHKARAFPLSSPDGAGLWATVRDLIRPRRSATLRKKTIMIHDAPGEAARDLNRYMLTTLFPRVGVAAMVIDAADLFAEPAGLDNTLDVVNRQIEWVLEYNGNRKHRPLRVALLINKVDTLSDALKRRLQRIKEGAGGINQDLPSFWDWYPNQDWPGKVSARLAGKDLLPDYKALEEDPGGLPTSPTFARLVFDAWTQESNVRRVPELATLIGHLGRLQQLAAGDPMAFEVFFTWTDLSHPSGIAPLSHGLAEFMAWALQAEPGCFGNPA